MWRSQATGMAPRDCLRASASQRVAARIAGPGQPPHMHGAPPHHHLQPQHLIMQQQQQARLNLLTGEEMLGMKNESDSSGSPNKFSPAAARMSQQLGGLGQSPRAMMTQAAGVASSPVIPQAASAGN